MTNWLWALQIFWNMASVILMTWIWFRYRRAALSAPVAESSILGDEMQEKRNRAVEVLVEREVQQYREKVSAHLAQLLAICERAQTIVEKAQGRAVAFSPSLEEVELSQVARPETVLVKKGTTIPTLDQIEKSKERFTADLAVDLRSLLKDQLA